MSAGERTSRKKGAVRWSGANLSKRIGNGNGEEAAEHLLKKLPAFYRENPGALAALVKTVAATLVQFQKDLSVWEASRRIPAAAEDPFSREGFRKLLAFLEGRPLHSDSQWKAGNPFWRSLSATGSLAEWIRRKAGVRPTLWPGLSLEVAGQGKLRVSLGKAGSSLVMAWSGKGDGIPAPERVKSLRDIPLEHLPVGLEMQCASLVSDPPGNPYVDGLLLEGELLDPWS